MLERFLEQQAAIEATLFSKDIKRNAKDVYTLSIDDITTGEKVKCILEPIKTITTLLCDTKLPTISMIHPFKEMMLKTLLSSETESDMEDNSTVAAVKTAIRNDLQQRYTDPETLNYLLESSFLDPRFKSMPYIDEPKRIEVHTAIILKAAALQGTIAKCIKVKTEPGEPEPVIEQRDPSLPTLPVPSDQAHSSQSSSATCPVVKKRKSAIHDLFGDIFVTKVEPATATTIHDKVEKEMSKFKQEIIMDLDTDPLAWWKINEANFPLLANFAKKYLCVPATSVASERVFSSAGDIVTAQRSLLSPEHVDMLIFLAKNFEFK